MVVIFRLSVRLIKTIVRILFIYLKFWVLTVDKYDVERYTRTEVMCELTSSRVE